MFHPERQSIQETFREWHAISEHILLEASAGSVMQTQPGQEIVYSGCRAAYDLGHHWIQIILVWCELRDLL